MVNSMNIEQEIFVSLKSSDPKILDIQKRIDKLSLIQIWVMKAFALFNRYLKTLDVLDVESDSVKRGLLIEEIDICFMSATSYFLRSFLNQRGSLNLEINSVTKDQKLRDVYKMLMDLRNDEYVHWKGARSSATVLYSFSMISSTDCEFGKTVQVAFNETVGPAQQASEMRELFEATLKYIEERRAAEIGKIRVYLAKAETWDSTELLNEQNLPVIIKANHNK